MRKSSTASLLSALLIAGCAVHGPARPQPAADDQTGAVVANFWYAPGRAIVCGTTALVAGAIMTITLGNGYDSASELMHGACSDPFVLTDRDIRNTVP